MKQPDSITVLGLPVPVHYRADSEDSYLEGKVGYWDGPRLRIVINKEYDLQARKEVVLHELLHAIEDAVKTGIGEKAVSRFSRALFCVAQENPTLFRWLAEGPPAPTEY